MISCVVMVLELFAGTKYTLPKDLEAFLSSNQFGKMSLFTFWSKNLFISTLILFIYVSILEKQKSSVSSAILSTCYTLSLCFSFAVSVLFWIIRTLNYHNFYPKDISKIPLKIDFELHLLPLLFLIFIKRKVAFCRSLCNIFYITLFGLAYISLILYSYFTKSEWPYPFMKNYSCILVLFLFSIGLAISISFFLIFRKCVDKKIKMISKSTAKKATKKREAVKKRSKERRKIK